MFDLRDGARFPGFVEPRFYGKNMAGFLHKELWHSPFDCLPMVAWWKVGSLLAWLAGWVDGWKNGWMDGWMDGCRGGWVDGWMDGWMHGWMTECMD